MIGPRDLLRKPEFQIVAIISVVVGTSIFGASNYGPIVAGLWTVLICISSGTFYVIHMNSKSIFESESEIDRSGSPSDASDELREFVYLDSLSVQSLLASLSLATPEQTTEINEQTEQVKRRAGLKAGLGSSGGGSVGGSVDLSKTDTGTELIETSKRINDQYVFEQLRRELGDRISEMPDYWKNSPEDYNLDAHDLDIVKIRGKGRTDPIYRAASVLSIVSRMEDIQSEDRNRNGGKSERNLSESIEEVLDGVYGGKIGVEFIGEGDLTYVAEIDEENLWVEDPRRVFADSREYTVLARVVGSVSEADEWDYIDLLRVGGTVLDTNSVSSVRQVVQEFISLVNGYEQDVPLPNLENTDLEQLSNEEDVDTEPSSIKIEIENKKISVEGPALVVDPIAIYW